jgi:pyruvate dehydrogenase E1 component beta subunit
VIDLRTLSPIDMDTVIDSVERTGRLVCVDEAHPRCSIASDDQLEYLNRISRGLI